MDRCTGYTCLGHPKLNLQLVSGSCVFVTCLRPVHPKLKRRQSETSNHSTNLQLHYICISSDSENSRKPAARFSLSLSQGNGNDTLAINQYTFHLHVAHCKHSFDEMTSLNRVAVARQCKKKNPFTCSYSPGVLSQYGCFCSNKNGWVVFGCCFFVLLLLFFSFFVVVFSLIH